MLQRAAINASPVHEVPPIVHEVLRLPGQPLDLNTCSLMGPRFDHGFDGAWVHTDAQAAESPQAVDAPAYTAGQHAVFGTGRYTPGTLTGKNLVACKLAHVPAVAVS